MRGLARRGHKSYLAYAVDGRDPGDFSEPFEDTFQCSELGSARQDSDDAEGRLFNEILDQVKPDVVFFHTVTHLPKGIEHNTDVRKVRMVADHDLWCPKGTGYFTHNRRTCHVAAGWRCYLDLAFLERSKESPIPVKLASIPKKIAEMRRSHLFDAILVASTYLQEQLTINGFPPEKIHICNPIVEVADLDPHPVPEEPNLLFIGSLIRGKGVDFLLRALHLVRCPFHLDIVGTGKSESQLRKLCRELELESRVHFVGWVDYDLLPVNYYQKAKVVVVPSCWPEPFTLVGYESMRHGRPVVAFDVGGNSNWLDHEHTGFLVPEQDVKAYAEAIEKLLGDTALAQRMGENGCNRVRERFSFERFLDRVEGFLSGDIGHEASAEKSGEGE